MSRAGEGRVLWVAWTRVQGRITDLRDTFGGESLVLYPQAGPLRRSRLLRYVLSAFQTVLRILRMRPEVVVVTAPPTPAAAVAWAATKAVGGTLVLDSHFGAFGLGGDVWGARFARVHAWIMGRAAAVLVANRELADRVRNAGGRPVVVHEPPPALVDGADRSGSDDVLVVTLFAPDEPTHIVWDVARRLPDVRFSVTGELDDVPAQLRAECPPNLDLVGFLPYPAFLRRLAESSLVIVLTTEANAVSRAGYEASYSGVPLIISSHPQSDPYFPCALRVQNTVDDVELAVRELRAESATSRSHRIEGARSAAMLEWERQRTELADVLRRPA